MQVGRIRGAASPLVRQSAVAAAAVLWALLVSLAPSLAAHADRRDGASRLAAGAYLAGSLICHQRAERSFHVNTIQMPVCARCFGLYASAAAGALLALGVSRRPRHPRGASERDAGLRLRRHGRWLVAAGFPTAFSILFEVLGIWGQYPVIRSLAALPLGGAVGWFVTAHAGEFGESSNDHVSG